MEESMVWIKIKNKKLERIEEKDSQNKTSNCSKIVKENKLIRRPRGRIVYGNSALTLE